MHDLGRQPLRALRVRRELHVAAVRLHSVRPAERQRLRRDIGLGQQQREAAQHLRAADLRALDGDRRLSGQRC